MKIEDVKISRFDDTRIHTLQALRKEPMTVYGDGKQTRSFQYVSDLVLNHVLPFIS